MGVLISVVYLARQSIKNASDKRKVKKAKEEQAQRESEPRTARQDESTGLEGVGDIAPPSQQHQQQEVVPALLTGTGTAGAEGTTRAEPTHSGQTTKKKKKKMATDEDYMAFLDKANEDPMAGRGQQTQSKEELKALDEGAEVPAVLKKLDAVYVSDADEEFVPVCLKYKGKKLPDETSFAKLVHHPSPASAEVEIMDIGEWDPRGQYKEVVEATREATKGSDVRVYRVQRHGARCEYWVVGLEGGDLLGAKVLAVES